MSTISPPGRVFWRGGHFTHNAKTRAGKPAGERLALRRELYGRGLHMVSA
jgi:hypothetical protein